jgi:hypothetical protein
MPAVAVDFPVIVADGQHIGQHGVGNTSSQAITLGDG